MLWLRLKGWYSIEHHEYRSSFVTYISVGFDEKKAAYMYAKNSNGYIYLPLLPVC